MGGASKAQGSVQPTPAQPSGNARGTQSATSAALGGLVRGAARAGVGAIDDAVGGTQNRQLIVGAASKAVDVLSNPSSIGGLVSGVADEATAFVGDVRGAVSSAVDTARSAAGAVADVFSGERTLGEVISGALGETSGVVGNIAGDIGGSLFGGLSNLGMLGEGSDWGYLSKHLIARIYACNADGIQLGSEPLGVTGPVSDLTFEASMGWQSPFETITPDAKAPVLMGMLQSGSIVPVLNAIQAAVPGSAADSMLGSAADVARRLARELEGRTGITKLNSRQIFAGMPPLKLNMTLYFRATTDTESEVVAPYQRLLEWALPQKLADTSLLAGGISGASGVATDVVANTESAASNFLKIMFPSMAPVMVGFIYGNNRYPAMVIETISTPLDGPMDSSGRPIYRAVQLTLSTLTALDRNDVKKMFV